MIISDVSRSFGRLVYWSGHHNSDTQKTLFKFYFNKTFVGIAINDFTMHQFFWQGLEYKNVDRGEKQWDKEVREKEETVNKRASILLTT